MQELSERKKRQIAVKVASLKNATLAEWISSSERGGVFQIHNSQMVAIRETIDELSRIIEESAENATADNVQVIEQAILIAFQVWEFFRSKLAQRLESRIQPFLRACDELAWKCYEPFRIAAGSARSTKEPPLVFLDSDWSPFVIERKKALQVGAVPRSTLEDFGFEDAVKEMPFAVIGLPWYQRDHFPDGLVVCHEVGHTVELDFDLGNDLDRLLETAILEGGRLQSWKAWRREVFADTFACIAAGPSFVSALADALTASRSRVFGLHETYPSDYLRILYDVEVLRHLPYRGNPDDNHIAKEASSIATWWRQLYDDRGGHVLKDYEQDLERVAKVILEWKPAVFGGRSLVEVLRFGNLQQADAEMAAQQALKSEALGFGDIRVGFAAARIAFAEDPAAFNLATPPASLSPQQQLQEYLLGTVCKNDLRGPIDAGPDGTRLKGFRAIGARLGRKALKLDESS